MNNIFPICAIFFLLACGNGSSPDKDGWTANERRAIQEIEAAYGGVVKVAKTPSPVSDKQYARIELSGSQVFTDQIELTGMFASDVAWRFFKNLASEKSGYEGVEVSVTLHTGEAPAFQYHIPQMERVQARMPVLDKTVALLKAADYEGLYAMLAPERQGEGAKEALVLDCSSLDKNNGRVTDFQFQGFGFFKPANSGKQLLHLAGILKRERYDTPLSIFVDPASTDMQGALQHFNFDY